MSLQTPDISPLLRDVDPQQLAASIDPNVVQDILRSPPVFDDQAFLRQTSNAAPLELQGLPDGSFHLPVLPWGLVSVRRQQ